MNAPLRVPHTLVLLFAMICLAWAATWVLPQGQFATAENDQGRAEVLAGSYTQAETRVMLPPWAVLTAVPRAMADAQGIIFFVLIIGGALAVLRASGAIDAMLGRLLARLGGQPRGLVFGGILVFAAGSSSIGMAEEYIPFVALLVALGAALRLDAIAAVGVLVVGYGIGYGVAAFNPFTVLVAQEVAGLPPTSGAGYRLALFLPFVAIGIHHVWRYSRRVADNPALSLMQGVTPCAEAQTTINAPPLTPRLAIILWLSAATLVVVVVGVARWGWYLTELSAVFLGLAVVVGVIGRLGLDATARAFTLGAAELTGTALLIGFARAVALILEDGQILHSIVHGFSIPLSAVGAEAAAVGMLLIQSVINFFISSGSGQAYVTMPIMAPIGDLVGVSRQVAVLAFQFGDGFANMIVPTNPVLMGILGIAGIPYTRWLRFVLPLMLKLLLGGAVALVVAVWIGY
jgi:uncharacterized ion transporter superfamily protein YfcC